jgi:predicted nucleotide-binding protein (sugar kinase/HSP70/actin superfamily)
MAHMAKLMEIQCPCCEAKLKVDIVTESVITFEEKKKAPTLEDFNKAVENFKGEAARREDAFQKSFAATKNQEDIFNKKFDELLKKAKSDPDSPKPRKAFDLD